MKHFDFDCNLFVHGNGMSNIIKIQKFLKIIFKLCVTYSSSYIQPNTKLNFSPRPTHLHSFHFFHFINKYSTHFFSFLLTNIILNCHFIIIIILIHLLFILLSIPLKSSFQNFTFIF